MTPYRRHGSLDPGFSDPPESGSPDQPRTPSATRSPTPDLHDKELRPAETHDADETEETDEEMLLSAQAQTQHAVALPSVHQHDRLERGREALVRSFVEAGLERFFTAIEEKELRTWDDVPCLLDEHTQDYLADHALVDD